MAERKSGPVKPPVIDLKARAASDQPADKPATPRAAARKSAAGGAARTATDPAPTEATAKPAPETADRPATAAASEQPDTNAAAAASDGKAGAGTATPEAGPAADPAPGPPEERPADPPPPPPPPPPPRPPARLAMPWSAIALAAGAGALLGAGLVYLLAAWIPLPGGEPPFADPAPRLTAIADAAALRDRRLATLEDAQAELGATSAERDTAIAGLRQAVAALEDAVASGPSVDLAPLEEQLRNLAGRVDAIAAGASSADADALAERLVSLEADLAAVASRLDAMDQQLAAAERARAGLRTELDTTRAALAARTPGLTGGDIGPAVRLPLIVAGLETAFATGRPYAIELDSLGAMLPELAVPEVLAAAAESGLSRPDALASRFAARVPEILAGGSIGGSGEWTRDLADWARAMLALRPAGEVEGDRPEAVVSRLEAAVDRRDFSAAATLLQQLPEPMRRAAGELADEIRAHAVAARFVADLRARALAPVAEDAP